MGRRAHEERSLSSTRPPESASGQPVGQSEPQGGPYQPLLAMPSVWLLPPEPKTRPVYHEPAPDADGRGEL